MTARSACVALGIVLAALAWAPGAEAVFPGPGGKIAFVDGPGGANIWAFYQDGLGEAQLTASGADFEPAWSPDGTKIAFNSNRDGNREIYVMNADGSNETRLTNTAVGEDQPTWSPDGAKIAFTRFNPNVAPYREVYAMNANGTGAVNLTNGLGGRDPAWSPDGAKIAFVNVGNNIFAMNPDGTGRTQLTAYPPPTSSGFQQPGDLDWSPNSQRITFGLLTGGGIDPGFNSIHVMNADGSGDTEQYYDASDPDKPAFSPDGTSIVFECGGICVIPSDQQLAEAVKIRPTGSAPDWQSGPRRGPGPFDYARPKGATPIRVSLVPAFAACGPATNTSHGAPLAFGSCKPPAQTSGYVTIGTPDANGQEANAIGSVSYAAHAGNASTTSDEADVRIRVSITDVRNKSSLTDYAGELMASTTLRITDHDNFTSAGGPDSGTVEDTALNAVTPCTATASTTIGSTCQVTTTADTLVPGTVKEGARSNWELDRIKVWDGGSDGRADTGGTLFLTQGVFAP